MRYAYNSQKQPPAPFVLVTVGHPLTGAELRDLPAQLDTGADCTIVPQSVFEALGLYSSGTWKVKGVGGIEDELEFYPVALGIHRFPPRHVEVLAHWNEPWILLGRDILNDFRIVLDGPQLRLEI